MRYPDLIFDLYGTLVDIHTEEDAQVWEKTALYFGYHGAHFTGAELKKAFHEALSEAQATEGQSYECFPDIPVEEIMAKLLECKGIANPKALGFTAAQVFRICSTDYIRVYPGAIRGLQALRKHGHRLWLLSNAQRTFTEYELRSLGLLELFDGIYISSDYRCRKPDVRFYNALLQEQKLKTSQCLMIGNDRQTDIAGAKTAGLATLYMHTQLTPREQSPADPLLHPTVADTNTQHFEFEGDDWDRLTPLIMEIAK